jgi:Ser/Thr protein kinase RdoA (MazF antagonist)
VSIDPSLIAAALGRYVPNRSWLLVDERLGNDNDIAIVELKQTGERLVFRFPHAEHDYMKVRTGDDHRFEVELQEFFRGHGLPIPRIHQSVNGATIEQVPWNGRDQTVIVTDYVAGEHPDQYSPPRIAAVATLMATMHQLAAEFRFDGHRSWPGTLIEMTADRISRFRALQLPDSLAAPAAELREIITTYETRAEFFELADLPRGVIHGDLTSSNLLFREGSIVGLLDFDDSRNSYFVEDIVKSLLFNFGELAVRLLEDHGSVRHFLAAYEAIRPLQESERRALPLFFEARGIYEVAKYFFRLDRDAQAYHSRIVRYLDRRRQFITLFQ